MPAPLAASRLTLLFEFDISNVDNWKSLSTRNHEDACKQAMIITKILPPDFVSARSILAKEGTIVNLAALQALPFDEWHEKKSPGVHLEYLYSVDTPIVCMRVITTLAFSDGVTAVRSGLHTLEAIEGTEIGGGKPFKQNPPFQFGVQNAWNMFSTIAATMYKLNTYKLWEYFFPPTEAEIAVPTNPVTYHAYYDKQKNPEPAMYQLYVPKISAHDAYLAFLASLQAWSDSVGFKDIFILINFSPKACPAIIPNTSYMRGPIDKRYSCIFIPPGGVPTGKMWTTMNITHSERLFLNNYGSHSTTFKAILKVWQWDWLNVAACCSGAGCININGQFAAWTRWTPVGIEQQRKNLTDALGEPVCTMRQNLNFPRHWLED
jgi:hypothetical protein